MSHSSRLRLVGSAICMLAIMSLTPLSAQLRTWTDAQGKTSFKAELLNAYGDTAFFEKEDKAIIHLPISLLSKPDIAKILSWAAKRDAEPNQVLMMNKGQVAEDIKKQWPNQIIDGKLKDEDINNIPTPCMFAFIMIKSNASSLSRYVQGIAEAENKLNKAYPNFMKTVVITPLKENKMKELSYMLGSFGNDGWLMPNEWQYKDNKEIWNGYWRMPEVSVLIVDSQGTVLCDSSAKEPDGSDSDPAEFLNSMLSTAERMANGGPSVPNPLLNDAALSELIEKLKKDPKGNPAPQAIAFNPTDGIEPKMLEQLNGAKLQVEMVITETGRVSDIKVLAGGGSMEEELLRCSSMFWRFIPVIKDGKAEAKKVVVPIRINLDSGAAK